MRALLLVAVLAGAARADETAAFLKVGVGARALGMGGAYTAIADDVNSVAWNPAGLSSVGRRELGVTHTELALGTRYDFAGVAQPLKYGTLAAAGGYLSQGSIDARDASGKSMGGYNAADSVVSVGFASRLERRVRLGADLKYIQSRIASYSAQSYAVDLGGQYALARVGPGVPLVGLAVQNVGPGMRFLDQTSGLPLTIAVGAGYRLPLGITFAADYKQRPNSRTSEIDVGTEYAIFSSFSLRGGYASNRALNAAGSSGPASQLNGFAAGFGLKALSYTLDYSMTPFGELGNVQRFSLGAKF